MGEADNDVPVSARKLDVDARMKEMMREVLFYCVFLVLLLVVVNGQQDVNSYRQNSNIILQLTFPGLSNQVCAYLILVYIRIYSTKMSLEIKDRGDSFKA